MKAFSKRVALMLRDDSLRELLRLVITGSDHYQIVSLSSGYEGLVSLMRNIKPEVVVMDLQFDRMYNGIEAIKTIRSLNLHSRILVLSECKRPDIIFAAFKAGASGYILKRGETHKEFLTCLEELRNGGAPLSPEIARIVVQSFHVVARSELTRRESEVLQLLTEGKTYREISEELIISKQTSKAHIRNIYQKLNVNSKDQAIAKGVEKRIVYRPNTKPLPVFR